MINFVSNRLHFWSWKPGLELRLSLSLALLLLVVTASVILFINALSGLILPGRVSQQFVLRPLSQPDTFEFVATEPEAFFQEVLSEIRDLSIYGFLVVVPLGAASAYLVTRRGLRPVGELSRTASLISASTLTTRISVPEAKDALRDLALAFNRMLERLEQAFDQQQRFVSDAAHELRTPLSVLRTNLEVSLSDASATGENYRETLTTIERSLARLEELTEGLLIVSKDGLHKKDLVLLGPLIEECRLNLQPLAEQNQVSLRVEGDWGVVVRGDANLLERVFCNLIENGIRYNVQEGEVVVSIDHDEQNAIVAVADTGVGIPLETQAHIFERFYRVDPSRSRETGGVGLGLSVAEHLIRAHDGRIEVNSTPNRGTTFTVRLPLCGQ